VADLGGYIGVIKRLSYVIRMLTDADGC
jgi:hypothetical protein